MGRKKRKPPKELAEGINLLSDSPIELLDEEGIITHEEWDRRIKMRIEEIVRLATYREFEEGAPYDLA